MEEIDDFRIWQTLVQTAVVGTARASLPPPILEQLGRKGLDMFTSQEEALLGAAALTRLRIKAGRVFPEWKTALPESLPPQMGVIHSQASRFLGPILNGPFSSAFGEWLDLFLKRKLSLPPESMPALLDLCVQDESVREALAPFLGEQAQWLILQNPKWASLALSDEPGLWRSGSREQRMAVWGNLRKKDPTLALSLIEETWDSESFDDKIHVLDAMAANLSAADIPLLKKGQADRRREIRHTAGRLLVQIPETELHRQLLAFCDSLIPFTGKKIRILYPGEWPEWALENGLIPKEKNPYPEEVLRALIQWVPPSHWVEKWEVNTEMILEYLLQYSEVKPLKKGMIDATVLYGDAEWAGAILEYQSMGLEDLEISMAHYEQLTGLLPAENFQALVARAWDDAAFDLEEFSPAEDMLLYSRHPWEEAFSREWLGAFQQLLIASGGDYWDLWDYRQFLRHAAYRVPPIPDAPWLGGWEQIPQRGLYVWKDDIDYFLRVVHFRIDMHEAFE